MPIGGDCAGAKDDGKTLGVNGACVIGTNTARTGLWDRVIVLLSLEICGGRKEERFSSDP